MFFGGFLAGFFNLSLLCHYFLTNTNTTNTITNNTNNTNNTNTNTITITKAV